MLLLHNNPIIDKAVHAAGLLPAAVALALQHERCSALHCRVVEMLRCSLASSVEDLWRGLFRPGYARDMKQESGELMPRLQQSLMQIGEFVCGLLGGLDICSEVLSGLQAWQK